MSTQQSNGHSQSSVIYINQQPWTSPNPTTGEALYALGQVALEHELYRVEDKESDDAYIDNGPDIIRLRDREQFGSRPVKVITVIVNGKKKQVKTKTLSFDQLVGLAFDPVPTGPNIIFTITYRSGPRPNPEGTLQVGHSVKIKEGMVFNVTATDKS